MIPHRLMHGTAANSVQRAIEQKLTDTLKPLLLKVTNESHMHRGHAGVQDTDSTETHFSIVVVSEAFTDMSRLDRQRLVNKLLKDQFDNGLHAATMMCKAPNDPSR